MSSFELFVLFKFHIAAGDLDNTLYLNFNIIISLPASTFEMFVLSSSPLSRKWCSTLLVFTIKMLKMIKHMKERIARQETAAITPGCVTGLAGRIGTIFWLQVYTAQRAISSYVFEQFDKWQGMKQLASYCPLKYVMHISSIWTSTVHEYDSQPSNLKKNICFYKHNRQIITWNIIEYKFFNFKE